MKCIIFYVNSTLLRGLGFLQTRFKNCYALELARARQRVEKYPYDIRTFLIVTSTYRNWTLLRNLHLA